MTPDLEPVQDIDPRLRDVLVPRAVVRAPELFGGTSQGDCLRGAAVVRDGRIVALEPVAPGPQPQMLIPAPVEAHCHLDKCHSIDRLGPVGGDLGAALDAQRADKGNWSADDLRARMSRGLGEIAASGCRAVRSHIDWGEQNAPPLAWSVLRALSGDFPQLEIQTAALTSIAELADRTFCIDAASHVAAQPGGVLGTFILQHDPKDIASGLAHAFEAADRFGLALDFHVDEGLGDFNGLEAICDRAIENRFEGPLLLGHAVSLADRQGDDLKRLLDKLLRARATVCALPTTNLYLQGRGRGTPDRRGLTRLRELSAAGVPIVVASDNVGDAFCPMGQHDPRAALHLASLAAHLDPPMGDWLPAITTSAASALGLSKVYMEDHDLTDLRLCAVSSTADLVAGRVPLSALRDQPTEGTA